MTIFLSTGPVISTLLSSSPFIGGGPCQLLSSRTWAVSGRKSGRPPASNWVWRSTRRLRRFLRVGLKLRCSLARKVRASGVRIEACAPSILPVVQECACQLVFK